MDEQFKIFYQNPKIDFLFGYFGGDPVPTKQDKFKPVSMAQINEDGTEEIFNNFYVRQPDQAAIQKFNNYIQGLAKNTFNGSNKIMRPNEVEVVLSFSITEKRYRTVDIDNLAKAVLDSLNNIAFEDDSQVASLICSKHIHPLKLNGLLIAITKLTDKCGGFREEIKLFSEKPWK
jgi:Holliday junction resolvase RusA-like endonuclease